MGRYFFDVIADGELTPDEDGMILPDMASVRREVSLSLADLARDTVRREGCPRLAISVRNEDGPICEAAFQWRLETKHGIACRSSQFPEEIRSSLKKAEQPLMEPERKSPWRNC